MKPIAHSCLLTILLPIISAAPLLAARKPLDRKELRFPDGPIKAVKNKETGDFILRWKTPEGKMEETLFVPATKVDVIVKASVDFDVSSGSFLFRYSMDSLKTSRQRVTKLMVELGDAVYDVESPEGWKPSPLSFRSVLMWSDERMSNGRPPGLRAGGSLDHFGFRASGYANVQRFKDKLSTKDGFFYNRATAPGIVQCWVQGESDLVKIQGEAPEELGDVLPRLLDDSVSGFTVGPVPISEPFDPVDFVSRLMDYNKRSLAEGWIDDQEFSKTIDRRLFAIREALQMNNYAEAESLSRHLGNSLDEDPAKKKLGPEAYALLRLNADYLGRQISKLRRVSRPEGSGPK